MRNEPLRPKTLIRTSSKKTSNKRRNIAIALCSVILALIITVYVVFFTSPEPQPVYVFQSVQERQAVAQSKYNEIRNLTIPAAPNTTNNPQRAELVLSEKETNAIVQTFVESDPKIYEQMKKLGVQNPTVRLKNNSLDINANVSYSGITVPVTIDMAIVQGLPNTVGLAVTSAKIGRMPVGNELRQKLTNAVNSAAPGGLLKLPKGINSLRVEAGRLVVIPDANPSSTTSTPLTPPYSYARP